MPDIQESWNLLSSAEPTPSFDISSVSNGRLEDYRSTPHQGSGVNEFFGVHPGSSGSRSMVNYTDLPVAPGRHATTSCPGAATTAHSPLRPTWNSPLNTAVDIPIRYSTPLDGNSSGDSSDCGSGESISCWKGFMNTVASSLPLGGENTTITWTPDGTGIPLAHEACPIFDVQPGTASLSFHMSLPAGTALTQIYSSPLLGPEWFLRRTLDAPESHTTAFDNEDDARYAVFGHPPAGPWAFCGGKLPGYRTTSEENYGRLHAA